MELLEIFKGFDHFQLRENFYQHLEFKIPHHSMSLPIFMNRRPEPNALSFKKKFYSLKRNKKINNFYIFNLKFIGKPELIAIFYRILTEDLN